MENFQVVEELANLLKIMSRFGTTSSDSLLRVRRRHQHDKDTRALLGDLKKTHVMRPPKPNPEP